MNGQTQSYTDQDGRVVPVVDGGSTTYRSEYFITDHLGNVRLTFADLNNNGKIEYDDPSNIEVMQENHYYPFGLNHLGPWYESVSPDNQYLYNGKELTEEFDLNWYAYGARYYDPAIGRFTGVDPIADQFPHVSTYNYAENEPIGSIDLHGLQAVKVIAATGRTLWRGWKASKRARQGFSLGKALKEEGRAIKGDFKTLTSRETSIGEKAAALYDLVIGIGELNPTEDANVVTDVPVAKTEENNDEGTIYEVPGDATESGKPYVGRHNKPDPTKTRKAKDGRDRTKAKVVDKYNPKDKTEGQFKEQKAIDERGGIENLDNKRNEVSPQRMEELKKKYNE